MENFNSLEWLQKKVEEELAAEKDMKRKERNKRKALRKKLKKKKQYGQKQK